METNFASVAEAVAYLLKKGFDTIEDTEVGRVMDNGEAIAIIHRKGLLDVRVKYITADLPF